MALGITEAVAAELAATQPEQIIEAWCIYAQSAGSVRDKAAFVVAKLRAGENPPKVLTKEEKTGKQRRRYIEGKYAHLIEH